MHLLLDPILRRQHGIVTRQQAIDAGLTRRQVDLLLSDGRLLAMHRGVFRDPAASGSLEQRGLAATLAAGPGAIVSHRMALALHGMRNFSCDLAEVSVTQRVDRPGLIAHRVNCAPRAQVLRKVPVTRPARTLLDCATVVVSEPLLQRFVEMWLSTATVKLRDIDDEIAGARRHPGAPRLVNVINGRMTAGQAADSPAESQLGDMLVRHGLPAPVLHHVVSLPNGSDYELDWSYPECAVAFEMDGYGIHLRSLQAFTNDRIRNNELTLHGWLVLNFTRVMLDHRPHLIVDQAKRALAARRR